MLDWQQVLTALNNFDKSKIDEYLKQVYYDHYHNQYKNFLQAIIPGLAISKIKLKNETWDYLIKNLHLKDGKISSKTTYTIFNFNSSLNLSNEQINYLIKNSELSDISDIKEEDFFRSMAIGSNAHSPQPKKGTFRSSFFTTQH